MLEINRFIQRIQRKKFHTFRMIRFNRTLNRIEL